MKYLEKSFSSRPSNKAYRENFDRVFGKTKEKPRDFCSQCGQSYGDWACGPTHAMIQAERNGKASK